MPKNAKSKRKINLEKTSPKNSVWDIFRFGESYTSLILGIFVVVIATILLLTFVKGKNTSSQQEIAKKIKQDQNLPTVDITEPASTSTQIVLTPTSKLPASTSTITPIKPTIAKQNVISGTTYTIAEGDTLWNISEKKYKSGYNWVDIQKANNIVNPDLLLVGTKLTLPKVTPKILTVENGTKGNVQIVSSTQKNKITGTTYTIVKGDTLWDISIRAYADGYAWPKLARANNLPNPDLIYAGSKLTIPRN